MFLIIKWYKFQNCFAQMRLAEKTSLPLWKNVATTFWQLWQLTKFQSEYPPKIMIKHQLKEDYHHQFLDKSTIVAVNILVNLFAQKVQSNINKYFTFGLAGKSRNCFLSVPLSICQKGNVTQFSAICQTERNHINYNKKYSPC